MAVISEVKCGRCDRRYSGFRSRCPYCGARRNKRGKHADERENSTAKLVIGILLLVILVAATMVLIFSNLPDGSDPEAGVSPGASNDVSPIVSDDENITIISGESEEPTESPSESPSESSSPSIDPNVKVASVAITYNGVQKIDVTMKVGDSLPFGYETAPVATEKVPIWDSTDTSVVVVVDGKVTAMNAGTAYITVTVDDITAKCIIRVKS